MAPAIRGGDVLTVEPVGDAALRPGDVVLYRADEGDLVAHRLVSRRVEGEGLTWTARGDAATGPGETLRDEQVLGRVVRVHRGEYTLDLERRTRHLAARLWVAMAPLGPWVVGGRRQITWLLARFLGRLQGWKPYRRLAGVLIGKHIRYRTATDEDAPALTALYGYRHLPEFADPAGTWTEILSSLEGDGYALLVSLGMRIVGATIVSRAPELTGSPSGWWLESVTVGMRYRGAGIGQALVRQALEVAQEAGAKGVYLRVSEDNRAATGLYRKIGFRPAPTTESGPDRHAEVEGTLWVYHI
jgi:ribosomal protein S18 acetylase RimI-like enzyme